MRVVFFLSCCFSLSAATAQQDTWDVTATEILIDHNKKNFSDHKEVTRNQLASQGTVTIWKKTTDKFKSLADEIDKRLTSPFIIAADVTTMYAIYSRLREMLDYQQKALDIAKEYPWVLPILVEHETAIYKSGEDLVQYITLLVMSYGDLSKMKVSARKVVYHEIYLQINVLAGRCYSLYLTMKHFDLAQRIRNTKGAIMVNRDIQLVKDILNRLK